MAGDCRGRPEIMRDGRGWPGTTPVMSHDTRMIGWEVYDFNLGWYRRSKQIQEN